MYPHIRSAVVRIRKTHRLLLPNREYHRRAPHIATPGSRTFNSSALGHNLIDWQPPFTGRFSTHRGRSRARSPRHGFSRPQLQINEQLGIQAARSWSRTFSIS
jgi:hypothetical protein